jgi:eukaryotic-like serine/threonine-protein kinase
MASVYRGYDVTLGRVVAIKILQRDLADDAAFRTRFRMEAQSASRMAHPSIVRVFDAGEDVETTPDGAQHPVPYIVMELVRGRLLKDIIAEAPVTIDDARRYTDGILEALEYSHRAGVVHRDIKPGNVMVTYDGQVKVMDFGIARAVSDSSSTVAETTTILGTASYFSPEQAKGEPVDSRADLYSTGVVLYELLTGRPPFRGESPVAVAYQHVSEAPVAPSEMHEGVPRALDAVALRALAKDPFQRFPDAASFRQALDATAEGRQPSKRQLGALTSELYGPNPRHAAETARSLRQLSADTTMRRTQSGPPVAWIWAGVALLAVLIVSVVVWVLGIQPSNEVPSNARIVPDLTGMTFERAEETLLAEDLEPVEAEESSSTVPAGNVIRTDPGEGISVGVGEQITVYVSTGVETATVPVLVGLAEDAAREAIDDAGLTVGAITRQNDPGAAAGTVLSASEEPEQDVPVDTTIDLVVATGTVVILNYEGYTVDAATRALTAPELGLTVTTAEDPDCPATDPAQVSRQSLAPGDVPIRSEVVLTVCTGS